MHRLVVLAPLVALSVLSTVVSPASGQSHVLRPPVEAEVLDPFRLPDGPYGAGNRGIEYATEPGDAVWAAASGTVVFAGPVAGVVFVSIEHPGGLRTSYGPIAGLRVVVGDEVAIGDRIGSAEGSIHFSTRIDGGYVDPASLFGTLQIEVRLIPHSTDDSTAFRAEVERGERLQLYDLVQHREGGGGLLGSAKRWASAAISAADPRSVVGGLLNQAQLLVALAPELTRAEVVEQLVLGLLSVVDPPPCTDESTAAASRAPPGRRVAVVIDGLDSSSAEPGIREDLDLPTAGYASNDVVRFSYSGGLSPGGGAGWSDGIQRNEYAPDSTRQGIESHIEALSEVLLLVREANPDAAIDVYGHSLGGLVARHAIAAVNEEVGVSVAVTLASPHSGAPAASFLDAVGDTTPGSVASAVLRSEGSSQLLVAPIIDDLSQAGFAGEHADIAFPESVHAVAIGARSDVVVPGSLADAPGASHVVVGGMSPVGAHGDIASLPEVHTEVRLAVAGLDPACTGLADRVLDLVVPEAIAAAEHAATVGLIVGDLPTGG